MTGKLTTLIDKQDNSELVRDQIAAILAEEAANQVQLASAAGKDDPSQWALRVFLERSAPWQEWLHCQEPDATPIVNISWDRDSFNKSSSDPVRHQDTKSTYNIDCYGYGRSSNVANGGHLPGDRVAALAVQRSKRLVRNILMAGANTYLQMRGIVSERWIDDIRAFQAPTDNDTHIHVVAARVSLTVRFGELSPQVQGVPLSLIELKVKNETGEVLLTNHYDVSGS